MEDKQIIELYWERSEQAISATAIKYGNYCHSISYNILRRRCRGMCKRYISGRLGIHTAQSATASGSLSGENNQEFLAEQSKVLFCPKKRIGANRSGSFRAGRLYSGKHRSGATGGRKVAGKGNRRFPLQPASGEEEYLYSAVLGYDPDQGYCAQLWYE